tara:strand:+ start:1058 stop:1546 length:489 start_codon:yes stop_codon:yes gene_type:complete
MQIEISGGTKKLREQVKSVAEFSAGLLMSKRLQNALYLDIELTKQLLDSEGNLGDVIYNDTNHRPRDFSIRIDTSVPKRRILESVCHEMVHVKQFATGEWVELDRTKTNRWQGSEVNPLPNYWDRPWEVEAHGRECGLFVRWAEKQGLAKQSWTHDYLDKYQ